MKTNQLSAIARFTYPFLLFSLVVVAWGSSNFAEVANPKTPPALTSLEFSPQKNACEKDLASSKRFIKNICSSN